MAAAMAPRRLHRARGGHARLRHPQEEVVGPARAEGQVRDARPPSAASTPTDHRRGLQGVRAVRALRLQQGPRDLLRAHRLPDRVPQGELHGRVHDQRPLGLPRQHREGRGRHRRVPPARHRGPRARRPPERRSTSRSRARRSASGCWRSRTWARARSSRSSRRDARTAASGRSRTSARASTCASSTGACSSRSSRSARCATLGHPAQLLLALDDAMAVGQAQQRDRETGQVSLFDMLGTSDAALERPLPDDDRGAVARAAALGEGAPRALPVGSPARRARRRRWPRT